VAMIIYKDQSSLEQFVEFCKPRYGNSYAMNIFDTTDTVLRIGAIVAFHAEDESYKFVLCSNMHSRDCIIAPLAEAEIHPENLNQFRNRFLSSCMYS
jgi:hypothetical protein